MIGGGGDRCQRADHGIGITETNRASFWDREGQGEHDFGDKRASASEICPEMHATTKMAKKRT